MIDLTLDDGDDGMAKAVQLSLEEAQASSTAVFKPSDREPSANWAMVPSNVSNVYYVLTNFNFLSTYDRFPLDHQQTLTKIKIST